jgi:2-keto-4-pentenoate hydratase
VSTDAKTIQMVAARLRLATETGAAIAPIRDELVGGGVTAAYAVQQANTEHYIKQGRRLVGRKIGLTSKSVQKQLGVDSPDFGMLFADMALVDFSNSHHRCRRLQLDGWPEHVLTQSR